MRFRRPHIFDLPMEPLSLLKLSYLIAMVEIFVGVYVQNVVAVAFGFLPFAALAFMWMRSQKKKDETERESGVGQPGQVAPPKSPFHKGAAAVPGPIKPPASWRDGFDEL